MRTKRKIRLSALASAPIALGFAACGGGGVIEADEWVEVACDTLEDAEDAIDDAIDDIIEIQTDASNDEFDRDRDAERARDDLVEAFESLRDTSLGALRTLSDKTPDIRGGAAYIEDLKEELPKIERELNEIIDELRDLDPGDIADDNSELTDLIDDYFGALDDLPDAPSRLAEDVSDECDQFI